MARRPIFLSDGNVFYVEFCWNGGFALSQSRKNIRAMHEMYLSLPGNKDKKLLEVSGKSEDELGRKLSAFSLLKYTPSLDKRISVECCFQAGKVFEKGGPYLDLLEAKPKDAKRDERLQNSGRLVAFEFEGKRFPLEPKTEFYDWLYISALMENEKLAKQLLQYDGFTDIVFNPLKSINCQAKTCARYVNGKLHDDQALAFRF